MKLNYCKKLIIQSSIIKDAASCLDLALHGVYYFLLFLLGVGSGFQAGIMGLFQSFAQKSLYVYAGTTSQKYESFKEGRRITFSEDFIKILRLKYTVSP